MSKRSCSSSSPEGGLCTSSQQGKQSPWSCTVEGCGLYNASAVGSTAEEDCGPRKLHRGCSAVAPLLSAHQFCGSTSSTAPVLLFLFLCVSASRWFFASGPATTTKNKINKNIEREREGHHTSQRKEREIKSNPGHSSSRIFCWASCCSPPLSAIANYTFFPPPRRHFDKEKFPNKKVRSASASCGSQHHHHHHHETHPAVTTPPPPP